MGNFDPVSLGNVNKNEFSFTMNWEVSARAEFQLEFSARLAYRGLELLARSNGLEFSMQSQ